MNRVKTDNSNFYAKTGLRISCLPKKEEIKIIDCFHGKGKIWDYIKSKKNIKLNLTGIEKEYKKSKKNEFILYGDALKYIKNLDFSNYDIIDLDCYGSPAKYIENLLKNKTIKRGQMVFYTNIYIMYGIQNREVLKSNGISLNMYHKCPSVFNKKRLELFYNFLYNMGIRKIKEININNHKFYGMFKINLE